MPPVFPVDNGPDYSSNGGTAGARFIPEIWSGKLQLKFYKSTVLSEITNNDWEGEIKGHGDKVVIRKTPDIIIRDYAKNKALTPDMPNTDSLELLIDHGKYFNVILDDVGRYDGVGVTVEPSGGSQKPSAAPFAVATL